MAETVFWESTGVTLTKEAWQELSNGMTRVGGPPTDILLIMQRTNTDLTKVCCCYVFMLHLSYMLAYERPGHSLLDELFPQRKKFKQAISEWLMKSLKSGFLDV